MNLPNDIRFELLLRYVAQLTSLEENLLVESKAFIYPEINREINLIHDFLAKKAQLNARAPRNSLKFNILQTIGNLDKKGTLWVTYCPN